MLASRWPIGGDISLKVGERQDKVWLECEDFVDVRRCERADTRLAVYNIFNLQRHLVSRSTLRIFRAEAANQWR
jgi:hypothetical protein